MIRPRPANVLVPLIWGGIALVLLTPFVVSPRTIFPFVVGKALYSRSLIEVTFVSWALLSLCKPSFRPPYSRILVLLVVALGVAMLSAGLGVSVQRSLWSNYERMQGVIDQAHWIALAFILVSMLRTNRDWRVLLTINLAASLAMAVVAIAEHYGHARAWTPNAARVMAALGNPIFLGSYLQVNVTIALGFLVHSFVPTVPPDKASASAKARHGKRSSGVNPPPPAAGAAHFFMPWAGRCFWGATALAGLWALTLTASRGPFLGLVSGLVFLAVLYVFLSRGRTSRLVAAGSVGLLGAVIVVLLVLVFSPAVLLIDANTTNPLLSRFTDLEPLVSVQQRLLAWEAGIDGFLERPVLGWGPENYIAVWGRYGSDFITTMPGVLDHAHNKPIEELATKGLSGLLVHAAIWAAAFHIVVRAARDMDSRERVPVLFVGAALMGRFVHDMTAPHTAVDSLQMILLLAFVARLEAAGAGRAPAPGREGRTRPPPVSSSGGRGIRLTGSHGARVSLAVGAIALAGAGLFANGMIYSSARAANGALASAAHPVNLPARTRARFQHAIDGFEPLANHPRRFLFRHAAERWRRLRAREPEEAKRLLAMVDAEALAAVESEPGNWRIYTALVGFYTAVATTDPEYREVAQRYRERTLALAPHIGAAALGGRTRSGFAGSRPKRGRRARAVPDATDASSRRTP